MAGTIAAIRNNGRGIAGVAPRVKILPLKVLGSSGEGDTAALVKAIAYATQLKRMGFNIRVLNASLGGGPRSAVMEDVLREAGKAGTLFVRSVHLAALGTLIWAPIVGDLYLPSSGTSMAALHVAGVAALAFSRHPNMSPAQMRDHLINSSKPVNMLKGYTIAPGIISAYRAVGGR